MAIPLDRLLEDNRNIYQVTSAIIRRAHQISEIRRAFSSDEHASSDEYASANEEGAKVVSQAIAEVINRDVRFEIGK